ncbi:hypothetical protein OKW21_002502 [Catalinimonas alkaloidigena]|uniref:hypothetical protein n=1 Tax=Catalinimonas alkaloidigena TaxID=1075417 RepID=UPI00240712ED|nr:hypothetical protein [Catalinimonas alkaloidigena]MDF9797239.1 hypothetical protein [Catalinimonas alkaloidigena]
MNLNSDDKIIQHKDSFDLYQWSRQVLGITGFFIGWTPFFRKKLNSQTHKMLLTFEQNYNAPQQGGSGPIT